MRLQLTVVLSPPGGGPPAEPVEVEVLAVAGSTAGQLASALVTLLAGPGTTHPMTISVADDAVDEESLVGAAPLLDGAALTLVSASTTRSAAPPSVPRTPVALAVTHGPDAGRTIELAPGVHTLGRGSEAAIVIDDPRLSRVHALITVTADAITVADRGSTNGTELDGAIVGADPHPARVGATVRVGDTLVELRAGGGLPASVVARDDGTVAVHRRPRLPGAPPLPSITLPSPPPAAPPTRVPWVAMLLPLPVAGVMAMAFGPLMLAFAVMSPILVVGNVIGDRVTGRRRYAAEHAAYLRRRRAAEARLRTACGDEADELARTLPDPAQILVAATMPTAQVWERRRGTADALTASIGWWSTRASVRVQGTDAGVPEHPLLQRVPCALPLAELGVVGFCGERAGVLGVLRAVLGQLVTLHSPADLELVLITGAEGVDPAWSWLGRLPHVRGADGHPRDGWLVGSGQVDSGQVDSGQVDSAQAGAAPAGAAPAGVRALAAVVRRRLAHHDVGGGAWSGPRTLVVLDERTDRRDLADLADLASVLEHGPSVGICVVAVADQRSGLPSECRAVLDLATPTPLLHRPGATPAALVVDRVGPWWADRLSRALAPLRDAGPSGRAGSPPDRLGLGELLRLPEADSRAATIAHSWSQSRPSTAVPIGQTGEGVFRIDLATDGPHVLVAGTTGAGKSELLRTLVASLAVHHRPEHLSMVLIDYKGGAAFRDCTPLPHVAAVVTDLDERLADRALVSLRAELKRRERALAAAQVADFVSYQSSPAQSTTPLPRLVIVIDEFRALAEELPQFIDGMVAVAALGRSLGVHLVLATQRPAGVVTADIRANLNLRIGLRLRDRSDSVDVLEVADAAAIDARSPGRALARSAGGPVVAFQTAHAGARAAQGPPDGIRVRRLPWGTAPAPWPGSADGDARAPTDLSALVAAVSVAVDLVGAQPAVSPWLPPLPRRLEVAALPCPADPARFAFGLVDEPALQRQSPLCLTLDEPGHWGFVGGPGSGRSTALLAVAGCATRTLGPSHLHLYAVSGGSLSAVQSLPHCGAHVGLDEPARLERLVAKLSAELSRRRELLAASGQPSWGHWRRADPVTAPVAVLLLIDDWDLLAARAHDHHGGQPSDTLLAVLREGAGLGLTAVLAGDRALLVGRAASVTTHRVLLRMNDPTDLLLAGIPPRSVPARQPPGRGLLHDGTEVQVVMPPPLTGDPTPLAPTTSAAEGPARRRPWRVDALPDRVALQSLPSLPSLQSSSPSLQPPSHSVPAPWPPGTDQDDLVWVGIGGDELAPRGLSASRDGRRWAVLGGSGSGVSTALATVATALLAQGRPLCVVASPSPPWETVRRDSHVLFCDDPGRVDELVALRRGSPDLAVVVDDADQLLDTPLDDTLREVAALVDRDRGLVVVGARSDAVAVQYRGLAVAVTRHRTGILLGPTSATLGDLLGARVPVDRLAPPGRGYLVRAGVAVPIQVASATVRR